MADFDITKPVTVNGETFEPHEMSQGVLIVDGAQPTDYEEYNYITVLTKFRNIKTTQTGLRSGGYAPASYRYAELSDLDKFHQHKYPYTVPVVTAKTSDKNGEVVDILLYVDFANAQEQMLVPRNQKPTNPAPATPAKV